MQRNYPQNNGTVKPQNFISSHKDFTFLVYIAKPISNKDILVKKNIRIILQFSRNSISEPSVVFQLQQTIIQTRL